MLYEFANMAYPLQEGQVLSIYYLGGTLGPSVKRYVKVDMIDKERQQFTAFDVERLCYRCFRFEKTVIAGKQSFYDKLRRLFKGG